MPSLKHARGPLQVLVLPPTSRDAQITAEVLGSAGVTTLACPTIERLCQEIEAGAGAVLLSEEHLLNDQRQLLKATLNAQPTWSDIPVLVLTLPQGACVATLRTWQQSANVTLLSRPLNIDHFVAVVQSRLRDRKRQYVVRNLLESVEQRSREFKQLADAMPQMVFIADRDGRVEFLNQRAVDYTGSPLDPTADFAACFSVKPIDARRVAKRWGLAVASQTSFNCEFRTHHHDTGVYRWQLARAEAMRDASGVVRQWYGTCTDIHERKVAERKLAAALKQSDSANVAKSEFLANMSHEIRTPMTAILGYSELLAEQETDPEKRRHMEVIQRNGGFLLDIINDILDLSKIEAGKLAVDFEPVELRSFADEIRSLLDVRAQERGLELNIDIDHSAPVAIRTDPTRLRQIIVNLLGNAIKFTHEGSVRLAVSYDNNEARFDVSDSGVGMSEDQVDRLFEPFYQGDTSVSRQYGGTGLGLAISQRLASMLDGVIDVQSSLGVGSMFTLRLQAEDASDAIATRPGAKSGANGRPGVLDLGRWRILVVDDRRDVRFLSGRILDKAGATVDYAEDGVEATDLVERQMAERRAPHLVLMDMQMPKMDGYSATQRLRSLGFQRPIIALTADAMHGDLTRCIECGCDAYLSKPIDSSEMLRVVSQHLRADSEASSGEL